MNTQYIESNVSSMFTKSAKACVAAVNKEFTDTLNKYLYERIYNDKDAWMYDDDTWGILFLAERNGNIAKELVEFPDKHLLPCLLSDECERKIEDAVSGIIEKWIKLIPVTVSSQVENELFMLDSERFGSLDVSVEKCPEAQSDIKSFNLKGEFVRAARIIYQLFLINGFNKTALAKCWVSFPIENESVDIFAKLAPEYEKIIKSKSSSEEKTRIIFKMDLEKSYNALVRGVVHNCREVKSECVKALEKAALKEMERYSA